MLATRNKKIVPFFEYFSEATTACLVTMVQGNVMAIGLGHLALASQTGVVAGLLAAITLFLAKVDNRWVIAIVVGVSTAIVDYWIHPGMFGPVFAEAAVTGVGAGVLSYIVGSVIRARKRKQTADA